MALEESLDSTAQSEAAKQLLADVEANLRERSRETLRQRASFQGRQERQRKKNLLREASQSASTEQLERLIDAAMQDTGAPDVAVVDAAIEANKNSAVKPPVSDSEGKHSDTAHAVDTKDFDDIMDLVKEDAEDKPRRARRKTPLYKRMAMDFEAREKQFTRGREADALQRRHERLMSYQPSRKVQPITNPPHLHRRYVQDKPIAQADERPMPAESKTLALARLETAENDRSREKQKSRDLLLEQRRNFSKKLREEHRGMRGSRKRRTPRQQTVPLPDVGAAEHGKAPAHRRKTPQAKKVPDLRRSKEDPSNSRSTLGSSSEERYLRKLEKILKQSVELQSSKSRAAVVEQLKRTLSELCEAPPTELGSRKRSKEVDSQDAVTSQDHVAEGAQSSIDPISREEAAAIAEAKAEANRKARAAALAKEHARAEAKDNINEEPLAADKASASSYLLAAAAKALADTGELGEADNEARRKNADAQDPDSAHAKTKGEAGADAEAEANVREEAEAKVRVEIEAKLRAEAEAKLRAEAEAMVREEAEAKAREEAETQAREEAEAKAREEAEAKARAKAKARTEAKARAEAKGKARAKADTKTRAEAKGKAREESQAKARAQAKAKARAEAKAKAREEAEAKAREEAEAKTREEAEAKAREEAEAKAREEAEATAREEAEATAREEAEATAREEAEAKAREEAEDKAREEAEATAREEAEAKAREEAEATAREEAEAKAREEAEDKTREEAEATAREEAEAKAREEAEAKARAEAEATIRAEAEAKIRAEAEAKIRAEVEEKAREEIEARVREEMEAKARAEGEVEARTRLQAETKVEAPEQAKAEAGQVPNTAEAVRLEAEEIASKLVAEATAISEAAVNALAAEQKAGEADGGGRNEEKASSASKELSQKEEDAEKIDSSAEAESASSTDVTNANSAVEDKRGKLGELAAGDETGGQVQSPENSDASSEAAVKVAE